MNGHQSRKSILYNLYSSEHEVDHHISTSTSSSVSKKSFHAHWNFSRYSLMDMKRSGQDLNLWHSWCYILVIFNYLQSSEGLSRSWSYGSWIYNYLCNQCLSPLTMLVRTPLRRGVLNTTVCDQVCQWLATGRWFSLDTPVSSTI